jgi:hypothetical protein
MRKNNGEKNTLGGAGALLAVALVVGALVLVAQYLPHATPPAKTQPPLPPPAAPATLAPAAPTPAIPAIPATLAPAATPAISPIRPIGRIGPISPIVPISPAPPPATAAALSPTAAPAPAAAAVALPASLAFQLFPDFALFPTTADLFPPLSERETAATANLLFPPADAATTADADRARPLWDWNLSSDPILLRDPEQATRTTLTPVVFSLQRAIQIRDWDAFRPVFSVGAGVLRQTIESGGTTPQSEMLPMLRAGLGAEWEPFNQVILRLRYEYTRFPSESVLNPALPDRDHAIQTGVEIKF